MYEAIDVKMIPSKTWRIWHTCTYTENGREIERGTGEENDCRPVTQLLISGIVSFTLIRHAGLTLDTLTGGTARNHDRWAHATATNIKRQCQYSAH